MMNRRDTNLSSTASDEELVRFAQKGQQDAFAILYQRFLPAVYARVKFKIPELDVEDVTQEIFIAVLKSLNSFKGQAKFSTWIRTITNRKIVDYHRARVEDTVDLEQDDYEQIVDRETAGDGDVRKEQDDFSHIQHALGKLPQNYQEVLLMRFVDNLSFNEIALQTGKSLEATKSLFRRSLAALSQQLDDGNE